jgi:uncharacterized protein YjcR
MPECKQEEARTRVLSKNLTELKKIQRHEIIRIQAMMTSKNVCKLSVFFKINLGF